MINILEWYDNERRKLSEKHYRETKALDKLYIAKQTGCPHHGQYMVEDLFNVAGQAYPGMYCEDCGNRQRLAELEVGSDGVERWRQL